MLQILQHTPIWVFNLWFVLLILGYFQSKPRIILRGRVAILPAAMILLSFYGVVSAFSVSILGIFSWVLGAGIAVLIGQARRSKKGVAYSKETQSFSLPGSWNPLALMMAIFFTKYGVGVALARNPLLASIPLFIGCVSSVYGFLSGLFFAGVLILWRMATREDVT